MNTRKLINLEKAMLAYANLGKIRDQNSDYPYFMRHYNCVHIRNELVNYGFLELATYNQSILYYPYKEIQNLLKQKGVSCGNSKEQVIENAKKYLDEKDIKETFGYRCYIPTLLGSEKYIRNIDYCREDMQLDLLKCVDKECYEKYVQEEGIKEIHIELEKQNNEVYFVTTSNDILKLQRYNKCEITSNVKIMCNDEVIDKVDDVDEVYFLEKEKQIVFINIVDENKEYICSRYDVRTKSLLTNVRLEQNPWNYINKYGIGVLEELNNGIEKKEIENQKKIEKKIRENEGIFSTDGAIIYYISASDKINELLIENYIAFKVDVIIMTPLFVGDFSKKYIIKIFDKDKDIEYLLIWMLRNNKITSPKVAEIPVFSFCNKDTENYAEQQFENYEYVKKKIGLQSKNFSDIILKLCKKFPVKILVERDYYKSYRSTLEYFDRHDYYHVCEYSNLFEEEYKKIYLQLRESGIISSKWVNEFDLYMLVKSYYKDAIYQYHSEWLGLQSLDIYIPCEKIGIEYQGIQHYEPVKQFGGEKGYITTKQRDINKKEKCEKNGVRLLYWDYREKIQDNNLIKLFDSIEINIPINSDTCTNYNNALQKSESTNKFLIACYTMEGKLQCIFPNIKEAANAKNISSTSIFKVLRGERNSAANCVWRKYKNNDSIPQHIETCFDRQKTNSGKSYTVCQYTVDGQLINTYETNFEAEKSTGISRRKISEVVNGKRIMAGGFIWKKRNKHL